MTVTRVTVTPSAARRGWLRAAICALRAGRPEYRPGSRSIGARSIGRRTAFAGNGVLFEIDETRPCHGVTLVVT